MLGDIDDQSQDWMRDVKTISERPFLALTGDDGSEVLRFMGPPEKQISNFSYDPNNPKMEWRFEVEHFDLEENCFLPKIITESSENFLAQVTKITERGSVWKKLVNVQWKKQKATRSGRYFKVFSIEPVVDPSPYQEG